MYGPYSSENEDAFPVGRYADAFRIEPGIIRITGIPGGIEVVRARGEEVLEQIIDRRNARAYAQPRAGAVHQRNEGSRAASCPGVAHSM